MNQESIRKGARYGAFLVSGASAVTTAVFAWSQSSSFAIQLAWVAFFVTCSLGSDYIMLFVRDAWARRDRVLASYLTFGAVFLFATNLLSNVGGVGWQRKTEMAATQYVSQVAVDDRSKVSTTNAALDLINRKIAETEASLKSTEQWSTVVSAQGLEIAIKNMEGDFIYKRSKGCSNVTLPESRQFCDKLAGMKARVGDVQVASSLRDELKELMARQEKVITASAASGKSFRPSANLEQAGLFAGIATVSLEPDKASVEWTFLGVAIFVGFMMCIAAQIFALVGFPGRDDDWPPLVPVAKPSSTKADATVSEPEASPVALPRSESTMTSVPTVVLVQTEPEHVPARDSGPVPLPPRKITFAADTAFARRVAGIVQKKALAA
jgi:hypothetical protein